MSLSLGSLDQNTLPDHQPVLLPVKNLEQQYATVTPRASRRHGNARIIICLFFPAHVHVVVNRHVPIIHTYVQCVVDFICITVEWKHPITVSLLEWSP